MGCSRGLQLMWSCRSVHVGWQIDDIFDRVPSLVKLCLESHGSITGVLHENNTEDKTLLSPSTVNLARQPTEVSGVERYVPPPVLLFATSLLKEPGQTYSSG